MTIKELKKELGLSDKKIAEFFGYKNAMSYYNAKNGKTKIENGLVRFYEHVREVNKL